MPDFDFERDVLSPIQQLPDANSGDPVADLFTWEDAAIASVPMPGEPAPEEPSPSTPQTTTLPRKVSVGGKVSVATEGMTPGGTRKAKGLFGEADARVDEYEAESAARRDAATARLQENYQKVQEAQALEAQFQRDFQIEDRRLSLETAQFNREAAELEQRLAGEAKAERAAYIAEYQQQMAAVKVLAMQSGNPIGGLSSTEALGLAAAQFAQGFLAAQGIKIDVSGQVDRWVDRSIQEHQARVANMKDAAQGQLHLYELSRQNSQDEWEARQRYRGFVIAGLQTAIDFNARRFNSNIAIARGQQQVARLQIEADATERAIGDQHEARVHQRLTSEFDRAYKTGMLARESQRLALEKKKADWEMSPKNPKNMKDAAYLPPIMDPEVVLGQDGKPVKDPQGRQLYLNKWRPAPGMPTAIQTEAWKTGKDASQFYDKFLRATNDMMEKYTAARAAREKLSIASDVSWDVAAREDKTGAIQRFVNAQSAWVLAKVYNESGKAVNENEFNRQAELAQIDKFLAFDSAAKSEALLSDLRARGRRDFEANMGASGLIEISENDPERPNWRSPASPRTKAEDEAIGGGGEPVAGLADAQAQRVVAKNSDDDADGGPTRAWVLFSNTPDATRSGSQVNFKEQPKYAKAIDNLVASYVRPNYMIKNSTAFGVSADKDESAAEVRHEALTVLKQLALGDSAGGDVSPDARSYAQFVLRQIEDDTALSGLSGDQDLSDDVSSPFLTDLRTDGLSGKPFKGPVK